MDEQLQNQLKRKQLEPIIDKLTADIEAIIPPPSQELRIEMAGKVAVAEHAIEALLATEYDRGRQDMWREAVEPRLGTQAAGYDRGKVEVLKRVALEVDANVCECGRPWSETDLYDYVHGELKEGSKDAQA